MKILMKKVRELCGDREEQKVVIQLDADMMEEKKSFSIRTTRDLLDATADIRAEQKRLEDIDRRLDLAVRSGMVSESVH